MLDFRIATFLAVCETHNFTRAAAQLTITQPAVTQHIHYLENYYDAKLFQLVGKKVELTAAGKLLKAAASAWRNDEQRLTEQMHQSAEEPLPLQIGATITIGEFVLAKLLARFQRQHPRQRLAVTIANTAVLLHKIQQGEIQLALVEGYFPKKDYGHKLFRTEQFMPVAAAGHKFHHQPKELKDVLAEHLVMREQGSGTREILERSLAAENYDIENFAGHTEVNSIYTILQLVKEDVGITFLYEAAVKKDLEERTLRKIPLKDFSVYHDFTFLWDKASIYAPQYARLCEELMGNQ